MDRRISVLRTVLVWGLGIPITIVISLSALVFYLLTRSPQKVHAHARIWGKILLSLAGSRVELTGAENCTNDHPVLIVSNHQSIYDILAYSACLPIQFHWIAKKELFLIPFVGLSMRAAGYVPIDRGHREKAYQTLGDAGSTLKTKSILIFPEGTRTRSGDMLPFKHGASYLLASAQVPVLPIMISGSYQVLPPGKCSIAPGCILIKIEPEIPTQGMDRTSILQLLENIRTRMADFLSQTNSHASD